MDGQAVVRTGDKTTSNNRNKSLETKGRINEAIVEKSTVEGGAVAIIEVVDSSNQSYDQPKTDIKECPNCGNKLIKKRGRYGKFYGCAGYPTCRYTEKIVSERIEQES